MDIRKLFTNVPFDENMQPIVGAENEEYAEKILAIAEEMNEIESKLANTESIENQEAFLLMKQMYTANLANELDRELADKLFLRNELVAKMKELGFGDAYVELHERLLDLGFAVDSGVKENLVKNGRITYRYDTPYVVKCSRESGYLAISATLKGDGLYLYTGNDDLEEICYYEEYSSKAKAYIDLNSEYITEADGYGIEFSGQGYFGVLINEKNKFCLKRAVTGLIKMSFLIEREMQKLDPFDTVRECEARGKAFMESLIKDLSDGANGVIEDNTHHISYKNWDAKDLVAFVIKSSYKIGRNETIEKFRALTELYIDYLDRKKKNRKIKEYDKSQLELIREKTSDECECILKKLLHMTEEEFELRKERLFEFGYSHYFFFEN